MSGLKVRKLFVLVMAPIVVLAGCASSKSKPTPENFLAGINKHFLDHSDCLFDGVRFPFETTDRDKTKQMDSLVKASLLEKSEEMSIHASRYTVAANGARYAPRFCYGHREATGVDSFTPPAPANGFTETTVMYRYVLKEVPVWAQTPEVQAAFPEMTKTINAQTPVKITLAQTPVGWQVPE